MKEQIGSPINRVDGPAKVTGKARYAAEYNLPNLLFAHVITSPIAKGRISLVDTEEALKIPGVIQVFTHLNRPRLADSDNAYKDEVACPGSPFRPLENDQIKYSFQPIALVVAETRELAVYAASLVRMTFEEESHQTDLVGELNSAFTPPPRDLVPPPPAPRGKAAATYASAPFKLEAEYVSPREFHNPMELLAATAVYHEDGKLTVYEKTQGVQNVERYLSGVFGIPQGDLRVICSYMGGGFGLGLRPQYSTFLAVLAARELKRSVRVTLTRQQMFGLGHRPATLQRVSLGAGKDGELQALMHHVISETSRWEQYSEPVSSWSSLLYKCDNVELSEKVVPLDVFTPCDMRAPGAAWGVYAIESAMDELAVKLRMDPVKLRLRNYTDKDYNQNKDFSSKELRSCYQLAADRFGWARRDPRPGSMREGQNLVGWGMASGVWDAIQLEAAAKAVLNSDGELTVSSATADIGTGTYTVMTQIAAETIGLPIEKVAFRLGDSSLPNAPVEGGSFTATTVGSAVKEVCEKLREKLFLCAQRMEDLSFKSKRLQDVDFADGSIILRSSPKTSVSFRDVLRSAGLQRLEEEASAKRGDEAEKLAHWAHSAVFAEVKVDQELGSIHVPRVVSAVAAGRILNPKTARSQLLGGVVWGIGMALQEEGVMDHRIGRVMTHNLADYHVPVNADVNDIEVIFVEENDRLNPLGSKGIGEIGIVGVAPAIANAVYHATGVRVRDLPITLDKVLAQLAAEPVGVSIPAA
jgi:xanthine dehydrogenase YagR molybdenum-binding subunit